MNHLLYGLLGFPLEHSLSPVIHWAAFRELGIPGEYRLISIPPGEKARAAVQDLLEGMRKGYLHGLNVTIPYKTSLISSLDHLTEPARMIGAVNTLCVSRPDGVLVGHNTDAAGFQKDLQAFLGCAGSDHPGGHRKPNSRPSALILGAGGAARAVVFVLISLGWKVTLAVRTVSRGESVINHFLAFDRGANLRVISLSEPLPEEERSCQLIVNATPVGMFPEIDNSPWPMEWNFPTGAVLYDLVYYPFTTCLMKQADRAGLEVRSGLGMLVEQGALSFESWTELLAPRQVMLEAAREALSSRQGG